ncbi:MAG: EAL domain-containing protein [Gammaproteobacteria bacterium]
MTTRYGRSKSAANAFQTSSAVLQSKSEKLLYTDAFLIKYIPYLLCIKDSKGRWLQASLNYLKLFNLSGCNYKGKTDIELGQFPDSNVKALHFDAVQDKKTWENGEILIDSDTVELYTGNTKLEIIRIPVYDTQKRRFRLFIAGTAIQRQIPQQDTNIFSAIFNSSHIPFLLLDRNFKIVRVNAAFLRLTDFSDADVLDKSVFFLEANSDNGEKKAETEISDDNDFKSILVAFFRHNNTTPWSNDLNCLKKNDDYFSAKIFISPLFDPNNETEVIHYVANIFDITQQKLHEKRIMQIAHYDDLTGLPNRVMFCDRLSEALSAAKRHKTCAVVLFLDLDRFKQVNDSLGHHAGNELLKEAANRLVNQVRKEDIVARLSGDEFAVLLFHEKSHESAIYAATIVAQKIIGELSETFFIQRQEIFIGVSIGIAIYPEDADSVETFLKHADIAMYEAKKQGRNNFQFFHKNYISETKNKHQLELGLRTALQKDELCLYYQPQFISHTGKLWGAEVLIRWRQGTSKMIPPGFFIPVAEEAGLIVPIGKWILQTACAQQKQWLEEGYQIQQVSVNISARQFMDSKFIDIVEEALSNADLEAKHLELEITESMLIGDTRKIELQLNRLKKMGIKLALDDFGTGYSSLSYLKNFPIDILKIDQSFIRELTVGSKDSRIACAIIEMGHSLGQKIVAEGVENEMQFDYLKQRGCDIIQGYYFSPPLPLAEMTKLLSTH